VSVSSAVFSFALVAGLLTIIPGLDTALVLRSAIRHGPRHAFATAIGIGTGALAWGAAAAVGVSALLTTSTIAYTTLRVIGAAYMVWLGARLIWTGVIRRSPTAQPEPEPEKPGQESGFSTSESSNTGASAGPARGSLWAAWRLGALTNLLNPKIGAFYVAVLPQFIPEHASPLAMGLLLALVHDLEGLLWFTVIIVAASRMRDLLRRRAAQRLVDGGTGSVLIGFGLKLGLAR
jgi:threonine/homoserine/homoserine lactone efflux protein